MAKQVRVYEVTGRPYRTDTELVHDIQFTRKSKKRQDAIDELWSKYARLITKMKFKLIGTANAHGMKLQEDIEEYESRAFETFIDAASKVRLEDCAHIPNWSGYIHYWGYLMSMNRDIIKHYIDHTNSQTPIKSIVKNDGKDHGDVSSVSNLDVEVGKHSEDLCDALDTAHKRALFWEAYGEFERNMSRKQKTIAKLRQEGVSQRDISRKLKLTKKLYAAEVETMKSSFSQIISHLSKKHGDRVSYTELAEYFG